MNAEQQRITIAEAVGSRKFPLPATQFPNSPCLDQHAPVTQAELVGFVERQIAHKIGRKTFSREWTVGHIHDAAMMIQDWLNQKDSPNEPIFTDSENT